MFSPPKIHAAFVVLLSRVEPVLPSKLRDGLLFAPIDSIIRLISNGHNRALAAASAFSTETYLRKLPKCSEIS